jgi:hypothetical protein
VYDTGYRYEYLVVPVPVLLFLLFQLPYGSKESNIRSNDGHLSTKRGLACVFSTARRRTVHVTFLHNAKGESKMTKSYS